MLEFPIKTERLEIRKFDLTMVNDVLKNSHDEDVKTFTPDEYFQNDEQVYDLLKRFMNNYVILTSPLVYPIFLNNTNIGYIQVIQLIDKQWELGYHIAKGYTKSGYGSEAIKTFLPLIMKELKIDKILGIADMNNIASITILKKCDFNLTEHTYRNNKLIYEYKLKKQGDI